MNVSAQANNQAGFTLIELIMVIVILGILSAVALPKFVDLSGEANRSAARAILGSINSAAAIQFSESLVRPNSYVRANACGTTYLQNPALGSCTINGDADACTVTCGSFTTDPVSLP